MVEEDERFKFVNDLTLLEILNLLSIGMSSFNAKANVPSDILNHNGFIPPEHLKSQEYFNKINNWTHIKQIKLNTEKSKIMIFNYTKKLSVHIKTHVRQCESVNEAKLLGTPITDYLKWDVNTSQIIRKSNARMQLLRNVASFRASTITLKHIYTIYVRSVLKHFSSVWHKSLTKENKSDLERVQKSSLRII